MFALMEVVVRGIMNKIVVQVHLLVLVFHVHHHHGAIHPAL
jgi:hypothetical protein